MTLQGPEKELLPEHIRDQMTPSEVLELVTIFDKAFQTAHIGHVNRLDELVEISARFRMRCEAGQEKEAYIERAIKMVQMAARESTLPQGDPKAELQRATEFSKVAIELVSRNPPLLLGSTKEERIASFRLLAGHVERLWGEAVVLYEAGAFARACFLAVTCIEETGKASPARLQVVGEAIYGPIDNPKMTASRMRENPFFGHEEKHLLAAGSGVVFNRRLRDKFGLAEVESVLADMESGRLKRVREECLYVEVTPARLCFPDDRITRQIAAKWVLVAGEIMAEVMGYPNEEWQRLVAVIERFTE
jgi:AbiV family abortive infection protein